MTRARRTDANHAEITRALRKFGVFVMDLSGVGHGVADLLIAHTRIGLRLVEIKNPAGRGKRKAGKFTAAQFDNHECLLASGVRVSVVHSVAEALALVGAREAA